MTERIRGKPVVETAFLYKPRVGLMTGGVLAYHACLQYVSYIKLVRTPGIVKLPDVTVLGSDGG